MNNHITRQAFGAGQAVPLSIRTDTDAIRVFRVGEVEPLLTQNVARDARPFIHPITLPGGVGDVTENAPDHHPWQHGLYVGLNDVNGVGFWTEGLQKDRPANDDGTFHPWVIGTPTVSSDSHASWTIGTEYRSQAGDVLLFETQEWNLGVANDRYTLDLRLTFRAAQHLTFGEYPYGGLFLRMPFRAEIGGHAVTSEGLSNSEAEGQRARWVATHMALPHRALNGHEITVAVMDHPSNPQHPVPWRVDSELGIGPSRSIAGAWTLVSGAATQFLHRIVVFPRVAESAVIDAAWYSFHEEVPA